jgi:tetratricopeptide (TPR) repeat protein
MFEAYATVTGKQGSLAWTLTQSRLGRLRYSKGEFDKAAEHFRRITDTSSPSFERVMALLAQAACLKQLKDAEGYSNALTAVRDLPNIEFRDLSRGAYGTLLGSGETHRLSKSATDQ